MAFKSADSSATSPVDSRAARLVPVVTTALAAALSIQPVHIQGYEALAPALILMAAYHWTIYRPDLLPPLALFLIGTSYDLLAGGPPGVTALVLLAARAVVLRYRRWFTGRPFAVVWFGFALLTGATMLGLWTLHLMLVTSLMPFRSSLFRAVLTISLFPIASFLLGRAQRALMGAG